MPKRFWPRTSSRMVRTRSSSVKIAPSTCRSLNSNADDAPTP
jgi:hypothetical protein